MPMDRERHRRAVISPPLLPAGLRSPRPSSGLTPEQALANLQAGLDFFFAETGPGETAARMAAGRHRVRTLRRAIAARIEAEVAVLDALTPDADLEDGADGEDGHDFEDVDFPMRGGCVA